MTLHYYIKVQNLSMPYKSQSWTFEGLFKMTNRSSMSRNFRWTRTLSSIVMQGVFICQTWGLSQQNQEVLYNPLSIKSPDITDSLWNSTQNKQMKNPPVLYGNSSCLRKLWKLPGASVQFQAQSLMKNREKNDPNAHLWRSWELQSDKEL